MEYLPSKDKNKESPNKFIKENNWKVFKLNKKISIQTIFPIIFLK